VCDVSADRDREESGTNVDSPTPSDRLIAYLADQEVEAEVIAPGVPMPTVELAAAAIGANPDQILKSLLFVDRSGAVVLVVASGTNRVSRDRLAAVAGLDRPRLADPATVARVTGYPAGGVAPVGHPPTLRVLLDRRAAELDVAYGGGGAEELLLRIRPVDIARLTGAEVVDVVAGEST
jgi:prolyl-tRNA editing enzyme YbaK/EbsC (Cys-tRNA(Pro) deacylase)